MTADWRPFDIATSHFVASSDEAGLDLHVRARGEDAARRPVLFVHGATYASRLYDIPHPGASWLEAGAEAGLAAYAMDARGYGRSRSRRMDLSSTPYARADQVVRDIGDVVRWIMRRHATGRMALVGGSWGSITSAIYASTVGRDHVERLVLYAPIFAERNAGWIGRLRDPGRPDRPDPRLGSCRLVTEAETRSRWDEEIPEGQAEQWRDESVLQALFRSSLADDPGSPQHSPPAFRAPNGTLLDLWRSFTGHALYDPALIRCPTLLIRGGEDATSTRSDALQLFDRLGARVKRYVEIANGAHFVSAERNARQVFDEVNTFLVSRFRSSSASVPRTM